MSQDKSTYLCKAWGETDYTVAAIVTGMDAVADFLVNQWLGSAGHEHYDGTKALPEALAEMQEHWSLEGDSAKWFVNFEIGGVSVEKVYQPAVTATPPEAATAASNLRAFGDTLQRIGTALCLPAGSDLTRMAYPAVLDLIKRTGQSVTSDAVPVAPRKAIAAAIEFTAAHWAYMAEIDNGDAADSAKLRLRRLVAELAATPPEAATAETAGKAPASVPSYLQVGDLALLQRFDETSQDDNSYDLNDAQMLRLADLGVVSKLGRSRFAVTAFGRLCLGENHSRIPLETVEECNVRLDQEHAAALTS